MPASRKRDEAAEPDALPSVPPAGSDHDRVAMLSIDAEGQPDQHDPEVIIDPESQAEAAAAQGAPEQYPAVDGDGAPVHD